MDTYFTGSNDYTVATTETVKTSAPWVGSFFGLGEHGGGSLPVIEPEIHELEIVVASLESAKAVTVIVEGDLGIVGGTQRVSVLATSVVAADGTSYIDINLGALPGGSRIRCRATCDGDVTGGVLSLELREGRSGLLNQ